MTNNLVKLVVDGSSMYCDGCLSEKQILDGIVEVFGPKYTSLKKVMEDGEVVFYAEKKDVLKHSFFSYLLINGEYCFIKNMEVPEVVAKIILTQKGDFFNINGLGTFKVTDILDNVYNDSKNNEKIREIGLVCGRVDA